MIKELINTSGRYHIYRCIHSYLTTELPTREAKSDRMKLNEQTELERKSARMPKT